MPKKKKTELSVTWRAVDDAERDEVLARVFRILMLSVPEEAVIEKRDLSV